MPLGERYGGDKSESRYCGVEADFDDDVPSLLSYSLRGGFDFIVVSLMDPSYRPSLLNDEARRSHSLPFAGSDLVLSPAQWSCNVVGLISSWIDLDSEDETLRNDSAIALKQEIAWASHLSLQACILPTPKGSSCANYAKCVNQILQSLGGMQLWLRIPLMTEDNTDASDIDYEVSLQLDSWELWNSFRTLCEHHSQLSVALDIMSSLPTPASVGRWFGEPVRAAILSTDSFLTNARGYPCLSKRHQSLITSFFHHSVQIILSGEQFHTAPVVSSGPNKDDLNDGVTHPLKSYLSYIAFLYQKMDPLPEQERFEV
ncbi:hypothetical protein M569_11997, partial [Genlisea aurea]